MNLRQTVKRRNIRSLLGFELFLKTACLSFSFPFFRWMFDLCLWAAGYSYVTKENVVNYILSPCVLLCLGVSFILVEFLIVTEANVVCLAVQGEREGRELCVSELFFEGINETRLLFQKRRQGMKLALSCGCFVLLVNLPILLFLVFGFCLAGDTGTVEKGITGFLLFGIGVAGAVGIMLADRRKLLYQMLKRGFGVLLTEAILYFVCLLVSMGPVLHFIMPGVSGVLMLRVFERFHLIMGILFFSINTVIFEYACAEILLEGRIKPQKERRAETENSRNRQLKRIFFRFAGVIVGIATISQMLAFFRNKSVYLSEALEKICITAHRGASDGAPENTMASIALAIEEGADYVELDVRLTADGVPVLLHDKTLSRTTGVSKKVEQVTYKELATYDAGSSYSKQYAGEAVPRLEDVLKKYGGKIGFNLELKDKESKELVRLVVKLIEAHGMEESCVVTSMSYPQLEWVKERKPTIRTGYILSLAYGDFSEWKAADFLSIRSGFLTENVVKEAHALGKEVHVWTVNKEKELIRMKTIGVDNIITDKPAYAREIIQNNNLTEIFDAWLTEVTPENS